MRNSMMKKLTRLSTSVAVLSLAAVALPGQVSHAESGSRFGPAVDSFCRDFNNTTPYADQGCDLCHAPSFRNQDAWDAWDNGNFRYFCPQVTPPNNSPTADAGPNQSVFAGDTVRLNGSGSSDVDGDTLSYRWTLSAPAGSAAVLSNRTAVRPSFVADLPGSYRIQLVVNDGIENSDPNTVTITTQPGNTAPQANAGPNQTVMVGDTVMLDGSDSSDVDGDPLSYRWALMSMPSGSTATLSNTNAVKPTFEADVEGEYRARLIVNDGQADSPADTITVTTELGNTAPVANAGANQTVSVGATIVLDGSGSTDADGDAMSYDWSFLRIPAGSTASLSDTAAVAPSFKADLDGEYVAQLIVSDGTIDSDADTIMVVTQPGNTAPVAHAGPNQTVAMGSTVSLDGSRSSDADGNALTFSWALLSAPAGSSATISDATAVAPSLVADLEGEYVVQLIVNDGAVNSDPDSMTVGVESDQETPDGPVITSALWRSDRAKLRVVGNSVSAGTPVEIVDAESGEYIGTANANDRGRFRVNTPVFSIPCAVQARAEGSLSASVPVDGAPADCGYGGAIALRITRAIWRLDNSVLRVVGNRAPANAIVQIIDADTGNVLGEYQANAKGAFRYRKNRDAPPCRVTVGVNGLFIEPVDVANAEGLCIVPPVDDGGAGDSDDDEAGDSDDDGGADDSDEDGSDSDSDSDDD